MKDLKTADEIAAEIREYEFQRDRGYAFVSYSHRDREVVYPLVLSWLRAGYNIYIDLDFERHGSDSNWADLMVSTLSSRLCRLGICFKSAHYRYSYASLLELLTMRGETVTNRHSGKRLFVDSVALGTIPDDDEIPIPQKEMYAAAFQSMSGGMGDRFLGQNWKEEALLREGLDYWLGEDKTRSILRTSINAEKMMGYIQDSYRAGYQDFYPQIAYLVKNWFISQDLNGNDYSLRSSMAIRFARFNEVRVEQVRENRLTEDWVPPSVCAASGPEAAESSGRAGGRDLFAADASPAGVPFLIRCTTGETIPLSKDGFTLGRSKTCDYTVSGNGAIGRVHVMFLIQGTDRVLMDQHSKNGTYLNGSALNPELEYLLRDGDSIRISSETFTYHS